MLASARTVSRVDVSPSDRERWDARWRDRDQAPPSPPARWLLWLLRTGQLPSRGSALDVASGQGRHALALAERGLYVLAVDVSAVALDYGMRQARARGLSGRLRTAVHDHAVTPLPDGEGPAAGFDVVTCIHYLDRRLLAALVTCLRPGGWLLAEVFTTAQLGLGPPRNPAFLARPGELAALVAPLEVVFAREGIFEEPEPRGVASIAARRPAVAARGAGLWP
jgi:SAM-dependent methyltransferase